MLRKIAIVAVAGALGAGASLAVGACGEDRGNVEVAGGTTGGGGTGTGGAGTTTGGGNTGTGTTSTAP